MVLWQSSSIWNTYRIQKQLLQLNTKYSGLSWKSIQMSYSCIALLLKNICIIDELRSMDGKLLLLECCTWSYQTNFVFSFSVKLILYVLFQCMRCCVMVCVWRNSRNTPQNIYILLSACSKGLLLDVKSYSLLFALLFQGQKHRMASYNLR